MALAPSDPDMPDAGTAQPLPKTLWIAVGLNAVGNPKMEFDDNGVLVELGRDLESEIAGAIK
jgi:hypothetical protein